MQPRVRVEIGDPFARRRPERRLRELAERPERARRLVEDAQAVVADPSGNQLAFQFGDEVDGDSTPLPSGWTRSTESAPFWLWVK